MKRSRGAGPAYGGTGSELQLGRHAASIVWIHRYGSVFMVVDIPAMVLLCSAVYGYIGVYWMQSQGVKANRGA